MTTTDITGVLRGDGQHRAIRLESSYATDIDDLWAAVTQRERLARWFARVDGELGPGADFVIVFDPDDPTQATVGRVLECRAPEHLVVSWRFEGEAESTVTVDLSPAGDRTALVLDHARLPVPSAAGYGAGWHTYLEQLAADLNGEATRGSSWDEREKQLLPDYQAQLEA